MKWISTLLAFVRRDRQRVAWEVGIAVLVWFVGYGLSWLSSRQTLQSCQDERTELLRQNAQAQALMDSIRWTGRLAEKERIISEKEQENHDLHEKMARDSVQHLGELDAIRAINEYIQKPSKHGRGRQREPG